MLDVALESVRAAILLGIVVYLWRVGRDKFDQTRNGWSLIVGGFGLLLFGSLLDISDNFEGLNFLVVVGETEIEAILEKFVGFLGGFVVIAVGLMLWVPSVQRLNSEISERKQAEEALRRAHDELETRVLKRTNELRSEITERKRAEEVLRDSRDHIRLITDNLPVAIAYFDTEQRYRFANRVLEVWYDRPAEEILGHTIGDILGQKAQKAVSPQLAAALKGKEQHFERVIAYPDGKTRAAGGIFVPHIDDSGTVRGCFTLVQDITERKAVEEALRESEARLSKTAKMAKVGYWDWDEIEDKAIYCSDELAEFTGVATGRELAAMLTSLEKDMEWVHPGDRDRFAKTARESMAERRGYDIEFRMIRSDGEVRHLREILEPELDDDGNLVRSNGIIQDITDRKQAEDQLRQAQKMEAVGQLTGGVAHDFNNLLAVILGNAELVADRLGKDDKQMGSIVHAATRGAELTQRLLSFSRQQALCPQTVDLNACVTGMTNMLRRTLGETIEIEPVLASDLWSCEADLGQLESALLNLAVNARDAMPKGGRLTIESANIELDNDYAATQGDVTPGRYVRLSVTDTGTGIPSENIEHVFEPFFTTKEVGEGSGLGLSMVYGFARQSGGHVTISSEPGCGTTVQLYLAQVEAPAQPAGQEPAMGDLEAEGETVLVVEDDPDVRSLVISLLQRLGYNILEAGDGMEALAAVQVSSRIDLLLSDVVLPGGVSGPDLAEQVRHWNPGVKVLFMSGYPDASHRRGPLVEITELLDKPFRKQDLAQKVRAVLNS